MAVLTTEQYMKGFKFYKSIYFYKYKEENLIKFHLSGGRVEEGVIKQEIHLFVHYASRGISFFFFFFAISHQLLKKKKKQSLYRTYTISIYRLNSINSIVHQNDHLKFFCFFTIIFEMIQFNLKLFFFFTLWLFFLFD